MLKRGIVTLLPRVYAGYSIPKQKGGEKDETRQASAIPGADLQNREAALQR